MTDTQVSPDREQLDDVARVAPSPRGSTRRFRGATYEDAVDAATDELGPDIHVLEANRIRRGGLGGFFATDLGVEVTVTTEELSGGPIDGAVDPADLDKTGEIDASAIRPYLPEDLTTDRGDGALPGQTLGMTDARLEQLLDRANRTEREQLPRRRPAAALPSFADQYADEVRFADAETRAAAAPTGPIRPVDEAAATRVDSVRRTDDPPFGQQPLAGGHADQPPVGEPSVDEPSLDQPSVDETSVGEPCVDEPSEQRADGRPGDERFGDAVPTIDEPAGSVAARSAMTGSRQAAEMAHGPMVAGDQPRLPAMSRAAVARSAPSGFLDAQQPQPDADAEISSADLATDAAGSEAAAAADTARSDSAIEIDAADPSASVAWGIGDDADDRPIDRPIRNLQDLMIDVSAGMVHGTVDEVLVGDEVVLGDEVLVRDQGLVRDGLLVGKTDETTRGDVLTIARGAPVIGPGRDPSADPGRTIDQSERLGRPEPTPTAPATPDRTTFPVTETATAVGTASTVASATPTLPSDPTRPMVGAVRSAVGDTPGAATGDDLDQARSAMPDATLDVAESGHPVAVVVPMSVSIDEPMSPLVAPPILAAGRSRDEGREASSPVGAGSPREVIGAPIVLGGAEFSSGSSGLMAQATDRLMSELGQLADDGGLTDLDRVRVAVTSTDGSRVEMAVERGNGHD